MLVQERMKDLIAAAGFVDVVETEFKWPIGPWSTDPKMRDLGMWNLRRWDEGFEGWIMALLTRHMGVSTPVIVFFCSIICLKRNNEALIRMFYRNSGHIRR